MEFDMPNPPSIDPKNPLTEYWSKQVSSLAEVENRTISAPEAERHTIFSLLALAIAGDSFNGNKR